MAVGGRELDFTSLMAYIKSHKQLDVKMVEKNLEMIIWTRANSFLVWKPAWPRGMSDHELIMI